MTGLANGQLYTFAVAATNLASTGPAGVAAQQYRAQLWRWQAAATARVAAMLTSSSNSARAPPHGIHIERRLWPRRHLASVLLQRRGFNVLLTTVAVCTGRRAAVRSQRRSSAVGWVRSARKASTRSWNLSSTTSTTLPSVTLQANKPAGTGPATPLLNAASPWNTFWRGVVVVVDGNGWRMDSGQRGWCLVTIASRWLCVRWSGEAQ